jgi:hypothetical protein
MRFFLYAVFLAFFGCAGEGDKQSRQNVSGAEGNQESEQNQLADSPTRSDNFARQNQSTSPITPAGRKIYIVCFYGENDHDNVARNMCEQKFRECKASYGAASCQKVVNPDRRALDRIRDEGLVIVVTHTTPSPTAECPTGVEIWDAKPGITPTVVSECIDAPVIWYGCFGASIAEKCPNVTPLADQPEVLDSRDPKVACRFRASTACIEELMRRGQPFSQADIDACTHQKMAQMCPDL